MWLFKRTEPKNNEDTLRLYRQSGDRSLFAELFKEHVTSVYGTCLFYLKDKEEAKDAVMQIFEKMITDLKKTEVNNFKGWLGFVVRNHCISVIRKKNTTIKNNESYYDFEFKDVSWEDEERIEKVNDDLLLDHMQTCLPQLKEAQRNCVQFFYLHGLSYAEISERTGYSINEVKSHIQNGKRNLKLLIEEKLRNTPPHV